jgi:hypothetical protein
MAQIQLIPTLATMAEIVVYNPMAGPHALETCA